MHDGRTHLHSSMRLREGLVPALAATTRHFFAVVRDFSNQEEPHP